MIITTRIQKYKFRYFHEILCHCGGRYINNPIDYGEFVSVQFYPGNYILYNELWSNFEKTIKETKLSTFKKIKNKLIGLLK